MTPRDTSLERLLAAARKAPEAADVSAPYGFSTRVVAMAFEQQPAASSLFARLSLRAAAVACLLAVAAVAANYTSIRTAFDDETPAPAASGADDPVGEVVDLAS